MRSGPAAGKGRYWGNDWPLTAGGVVTDVCETGGGFVDVVGVSGVAGTQVGVSGTAGVVVVVVDGALVADALGHGGRGVDVVEGSLETVGVDGGTAPGAVVVVELGCGSDDC